MCAIFVCRIVCECVRYLYVGLCVNVCDVCM